MIFRNTRGRETKTICDPKGRDTMTISDIKVYKTRMFRNTRKCRETKVTSPYQIIRDNKVGRHTEEATQETVVTPILLAIPESSTIPTESVKPKRVAIP